MYSQASLLENLRVHRRGQRGHVSSSRPLHAFINVSVSHVIQQKRPWDRDQHPEALVRYYTTKNKMHLVKMEITVSRSMSHMPWNISADRGPLLWLCQICNENKWFMWTVLVKLVLMLVERGIDRKTQHHFKQPLPLPLRVQLLVQENVSRL